MKEYIFLIIGILLLVFLLIISRNKFTGTKVILWKSIIAIIIFTAILIWSIIYKSFNGSIIILLVLYFIVITYLIIRAIKSYKLMKK